MEHERLEVGRVLYGPEIWKVQTLRNHVGNVVRLVELWDSKRAFLSDESPRDAARIRQKCLQRAAEIHDMGKPRRFKITYKDKEWSYSFAGHRFDAQDHPGDELTPYVEALAHLHHEYSVSGLTRRMAQLRLAPHVAHLAEYLPLDLYILEMCDQIEATVASALLGDKNPTARVFMDFQFDAPQPGQYRVDPFVFQGETVVLAIEWAEILPDAGLVAAVFDAAIKSDAYRERRELRDWLVKQLQQVTIYTKEVTLCPWL